MLTRLRVKNFKRFTFADIELGQSVVFIGANNSGKTSALQALTLWDVGLRKWNEKREGKSTPERRSGVAINRRDLLAIPTPDANLIWRDLHVRDLKRVEGKLQTQNVRVEIIVDGITGGKVWSCGLEFDYANEESFYCRPLRLNEDKQTPRMTIPPESLQTKIAFLPPMSGLAAIEPKLETGRINVLIGEAQTAQVLRNLCYQIYDQPDPKNSWNEIVQHIEFLFGARLLPPNFIKERGEITMAYAESNLPQLDLSSSGRGMQQTLLLLAYLYLNPKTILLLDEPDAHLEVLRQRQIYQLLTEVAEKQGSQIIAASHSEVVLNEAASRGVVVAFVGKPHRLNDRGSQALKALTELGWEQYYQAEQVGWVLYVEDATDLSILRAFAKRLAHPALEYLERPFVHYVTTNLPARARDHFHGLQEGKPDLVGLALFDRLEKELRTEGSLIETMWRRREIENYFCTEKVLLAWASPSIANDLFAAADQAQRQAFMREAIAEVQHVLEIDDKSPWSPEVKATDEVLDRIFRLFFKKANLPLTFRKADYYRLVDYLEIDDFDPEVREKLDLIVKVAQSAHPAVEY